MKKLILTLALLVNASFTQLFADSPKLKNAIEITQMKLVGDVRKGNTIQLRIRFKSFVDSKATFTLHFPQHIAPINRTPNDISKVEGINVSMNQEYERTLDLKVDEYGASMITVMIYLDNELEGFNRGISRTLIVESSETSVKIFDDRNPSDSNIKAIKPVYGDKPKTEKGQSVENLNYTVSISGNVRYLVPFTSTYKGLYGSSIQLWFRNSANGYDGWWHPVYSNPETRHTHYDIIDQNGNFWFNFTMNTDLTGYDLY